jgi:molybdopterin-guanine dinucleotide biosynthesis protein A
MSIPRDLISGLVLSGGRGQRMGGADKGLQPFKGAPMAMHHYAPRATG